MGNRLGGRWGSSQAEYRSVGPGRGRPYELHASDLESLNTIIRSLRAIDEKSVSKVLEWVLKRFNLSYSKGGDEEKVIDHTIILEMLLLHGTKDELKYRLALRGAALLRDEQPPKEVFGVLSCLYNARSQIVHNGVPLAEFGSEKNTRSIALL